MEPRVSLITLGVHDLERSLKFYRDGLGFPTTWSPDKGVIFFQTSGVCLALYPYDELARDVGESFRNIPRAKFNGIALAHNVRQKEEVDQILKLAQAAGGTIAKPAQPPSGAAIAATSQTPTATCGKSPTAHSSSAKTAA